MFSGAFDLVRESDRIAPAKANTRIDALAELATVAAVEATATAATAATTTPAPKKLGRGKKRKAESVAARKSERVRKPRSFLHEAVNTETTEFSERLATAMMKPAEKPKEKKPKRGKKDTVAESATSAPSAPSAPTALTAPPADTVAAASKSDKPAKSYDQAHAPVKLVDIKPGQILSQTHYMLVTSVTPHRTPAMWPDTGSKHPHFQYVTLRGHQEKDGWIVECPEEFNGVSSDHYTSTVECTNTELTQRLCECKSDVFTVTFKPILKSKDLAKKILEKKSELAAVDAATAANKLARDLMDTNSKTITARLKEANTLGGYSLVDDLGASKAPDAKKMPTVFKQINHREIEQLIHRSVRYVLKKASKKR